MLFRCCYNIMLPPNTFIILISFRKRKSVLLDFFNDVESIFVSVGLIPCYITLSIRSFQYSVFYVFPCHFPIGCRASVFPINSTTILICFSLPPFPSLHSLISVNIIVAIVAGIYQLCAGILKQQDIEQQQKQDNNGSIISQNTNLIKHVRR